MCVWCVLSECEVCVVVCVCVVFVWCVCCCVCVCCIVWCVCCVCVLVCVFVCVCVVCVCVCVVFCVCVCVCGVLCVVCVCFLATHSPHVDEPPAQKRVEVPVDAGQEGDVKDLMTQSRRSHKQEVEEPVPHLIRRPGMLLNREMYLVE